MQPFSGNQRPDLLTSLVNMSLAPRLPCEMHLCRSSSNVPRLPMLLKLLQNPRFLLTFDKVHNPLRLPRKTTSERPQVHLFFTLLPSKCASRQNGVHFFNISTPKSAPNPSVFCTFNSEICFAPNGGHFCDISTSKSGPNMMCFVHFDFEMCFAPQRRALFHLSPGQMALHPPL